jgi:hypothetical protein
MSKDIVKNIVENIYNDQFNTLKEDVATAISKKAVDLLENKKIVVGKKFFENK